MVSVYKKRVSFHETDCMGVVHHASYVKYFEDARVNLLYKMKLEELHSPHADYVLAVTKVEVNYLKPLKLQQEFEIFIGVQPKGRFGFIFTYELYFGEILCSTGKTEHVGLNSLLKVVKPPVGFNLV